jgi:hypothetical protein
MMYSWSNGSDSLLYSLFYEIVLQSMDYKLFFLLCEIILLMIVSTTRFC